MITQDEDEVTTVTEEQNVQGLSYEADTKWFKLLEVNVSEPFVTVGFLASITECVSQQGLNILIISTYSKDYALVKENVLDKAIEALKNRGFKIIEE